jgi:hypothetical protein
MSTAHRLRRAAALCAILCAALVPATAGVALAAPDPLAQERYYSSYGTPDSSAALLAQERYLSSYGDPEPLTLPHSPVPSDDTPWLPIALSITGALVIAAATATHLRRLRLRRRRTVRSTA